MIFIKSFHEEIQKKAGHLAATFLGYLIRNEVDYQRHLDYIHCNHGGKEDCYGGSPRRMGRAQRNPSMVMDMEMRWVSAMQSVVATELTRMLMEGGISSDLAKGIALPHISVDSIRLTSNNAEQVGQQIAQSVYGGIGHE